MNDAPALKLAEVGIAVSNATDIAKLSASVILTQPGLSGIPDMITSGRKIHQRVCTWMLNKIVKTIQTNLYVILVYLLDGYFVLDSTHMVLLLFLVDFNTLALSTDTIRERDPDRKSSLKRPQAWHLNALVSVGCLVGSLCVLQTKLFFTYIIPKSNMNMIETQTHNLLMIYFLSSFAVLSVRERSWFYRSVASPWMFMSVLFNSVILVIMSLVGWPYFIAKTELTDIIKIILYSAFCVFSINDPIKTIVFRMINM
jgi:H+-transporting ATPase